MIESEPLLEIPTRMMLNQERMIVVLGAVSAIASLLIGVAKTATVPEASQKSLDYDRLSKMLNIGLLKKADRYTYRLMLLALKKYPDQFSPEIYLTPKDIDKFPCKPLLKIDKIWHQHTQGKFSFTTQSQIWMKLKHSIEIEPTESTSSSVLFEHFAKTVNWQESQTWKSYDQLTFNLQGNPGHLPALTSGGSVSQVEVDTFKKITDKPLWGFNVRCVQSRRQNGGMSCTPNLSPSIFDRLDVCKKSY